MDLWTFPAQSYCVIPMQKSNQHVKFEALELVGWKFENTQQVITKYLSRFDFQVAHLLLGTKKMSALDYQCLAKHY